MSKKIIEGLISTKALPYIKKLRTQNSEFSFPTYRDSRTKETGLVKENEKNHQKLRTLTEEVSDGTRADWREGWDRRRGYHSVHTVFNQHFLLYTNERPEFNVRPGSIVLSLDDVLSFFI